MEMNTILGFILAVAIILVLSGFFVLSGQDRPPDVPRQIILNTVPGPSSIAISDPYKNADGSWSYASITIPADMKFSAKLGVGEQYNVIAMVSFKGADRRAKINGQDSFIFDADTTGTQNIVATDFQSMDPPMDCGYENQDNTILKGQTLKITTGGLTSYTLKLTDLIKSSGNCLGKFDIECASRSYIVSLFAVGDACTKGDLSKCQAVIPDMCNNTITLTGQAMDCLGGSAKVTVNFEAPHNYDYPYIIGEDVGLTFFNNTQCISQRNTLQSMVLDCPDARLSSTFALKGPIPTPNHCR